ncbi:hypothetical protein FKM82_005474 [Ascaphus truei]
MQRCLKQDASLILPASKVIVCKKSRPEVISFGVISLFPDDAKLSSHVVLLIQTLSIGLSLEESRPFRRGPIDLHTSKYIAIHVVRSL